MKLKTKTSVFSIKIITEFSMDRTRVKHLTLKREHINTGIIRPGL